MGNRFNISVLPVSRQRGKMAVKFPGLMISKPPRRSPRRRTQESLILYLHLEGNAPLSDAAMDQLLTKLSEVYFQTEGSITSALRNVTDILNKYLVDRNFRAASKGLNAVGYLTQVVLREDRVLYAQCGPSYVYQLTPDTFKDLHDPELSGPGLGVGKSYKVRYHQIDLQPNQLILLAPFVPETWSENTLKNLPRMKPPAIVERLLHKVEDKLEALILFPSPGDGETRIIEPNWEMGADSIEIPELDHAPDPLSQAEKKKEVEQAIPTIQIDDGETPQPEERSPLDQDQRSEPEITEFQRPRKTKKPDLADQISAELGPKIEGIRESKTWSSLQSASSTIGDYARKIWHGFLGLLGRILPDEQLLDLPSWSLGLIAVLVPLIMVIVGSFFYIKRGRNQLYDQHLSSAQTLLALASTQEGTAEYYGSISEAMTEITAARNYQQTDEVEELYQTIRTELDDLNRITRLPYQPLFSRGLGTNVTVSKIIVTAWNDLYMLNADTGSVIWAQSNPEGYQIMDDFDCGPIDGHITVGPLVDIVPLPTSQEDQATILGIDQNHTMLFCYADPSEPPVIFEDTSYTLGRGPVQAISMSSSDPYNLYILDPEKRAIWIEYQSQNYHEGSEYFGATDSPEMSDAVELVTNGSELFILHRDGYVTKCVTERADADPICTTPFEFSDPRPGQEPSAFFAGANFSSFTIKSSPGLAMYMLDAEEQALYRFSTQLEFQEQFHPEDGIIDQPVTAFAVTMSDRAFLAVDDQIYTAQLLP